MYLRSDIAVADLFVVIRARCVKSPAYLYLPNKVKQATQTTAIMISKGVYSNVQMRTQMTYV